MKSIIITIFVFIFIISSGLLAFGENINVTGTWTMTEKQTGCGRGITVVHTIKITQEGNSIKYENLDTNYTFLGKIHDDTIIMDNISFKTRDSNTIKLLDFNMKVSSDGNALTGGSEWVWSNSEGNSCIGIDKGVWKRKL